MNIHHPAFAGRARQRGGALLIVMLMLALLALFASANKRTNFGLNDELNRLEANQIERLNGRKAGDKSQGPRTQNPRKTQ